MTPVRLRERYRTVFTYKNPHHHTDRTGTGNKKAKLATRRNMGTPRPVILHIDGLTGHRRLEDA